MGHFSFFIVRDDKTIQEVESLKWNLIKKMSGTETSIGHTLDKKLPKKTLDKDSKWKSLNNEKYKMNLWTIRNFDGDPRS